MSKHFQERLNLVQSLSGLPEAQFEYLIFALKPPEGVVPSRHAPQAVRVSVLLEWAESSAGLGIDELQSLAQLLLYQEPSTTESHIFSELTIPDYLLQKQRHNFIQNKGERAIAFSSGGSFLGGMIAQIPGAMVGALLGIIFAIAYKPKEVEKYGR